MKDNKVAKKIWVAFSDKFTNQNFALSLTDKQRKIYFKVFEEIRDEFLQEKR